MAPSTLPYAAHPVAWVVEDRFPLVPMDRRAAFRDVLIVLLVQGWFMRFMIAADFSQRMHERWPRGGAFLSVPANGLIVLLAVAIMLRVRGQGWAVVGQNRASPIRMLAFGFLAIPACYVIGGVMNALYILASGKGVTGFVEERTEFLTFVAAIPVLWKLPLSLFVGVYEEVLFRGFLLSRLRAWTGSTAYAVMISSLVFGVLHFTQGAPGMLQTAALGLTLGMLSVWTRSLWPAIIAHAAVDAISLFAVTYLLPALEEFLRQSATMPA